MTQPISLRLARQAPRLTLGIGALVTLMLLIMPFLALLRQPIRWRYRPIP